MPSGRESWEARPAGALWERGAGQLLPETPGLCFDCVGALFPDDGDASRGGIHPVPRAAQRLLGGIEVEECTGCL
ncbi:MAG: hypothetical protein OXG37_02180 [Actinomycetia bacterium]|nr:hypothetical protein [Actinomycetes bacterium]